MITSVESMIVEAVLRGEDRLSVASRLGVPLSFICNTCEAAITSARLQQDVKDEYERRLGRARQRIRDMKGKQLFFKVSRSLTVIASLNDENKSFRQIASEHSITRQRVQQVYAAAIKAGIDLPLRKPGKPR